MAKSHTEKFDEDSEFALLARRYVVPSACNAESGDGFLTAPDSVPKAKAFTKRQRAFRKAFLSHGNARKAALDSGYSRSSVDKSLKKLQESSGIDALLQEVTEAVRSRAIVALAKAVDRQGDDAANAPHSRDATAAARLLAELGSLLRKGENSVTVDVSAHQVALRVNRSGDST